MRAFLEEYGIAIFVIAVIVILVVMASPVGAQIKRAVLNKINNLENQTIAP
ncbi:hypothetical protein [Eubacterium limosum]|uniref:hypothetical protein n=1 Tax=Eubacterium limosum TaxID=1736 RepID=UPI00371F474F